MMLRNSLCFLLFAYIVQGRPDFPDRIPNGRNVKDNNGNSWLGVGHYASGGGGSLNPFGSDFDSAGQQWTVGLCQKDSDGDGLTNGQELGDPNCIWTVGNTPSRNNGNNPSRISSSTWFQNIGFTIKSTQPSFTIQEANWLWLGVALQDINIPPGKPYYELTANVNPSVNPIKLQIIGSVSHTHYLGRKVWVEAKSDVNRLVSCNPSYDNENQAYIPTIPFLNVSNEDALTVHCVYDSTSKTVVTTGGEETEDEMCFVFLLFISEQVSTPLTLVSSGSNVVSSSSPQVTTLPCLAAGESGTTSTLPSWLIAHIVLGAVGFGFLMPLAMFAPASATIRSLPENRWFKIHWLTMSFGCVMGWIAFALALAELTPRLQTTHGRFGTAVVILTVFQWLLGKFRPHLPKEMNGVKSESRKIWEYVHPYFGRVVLVCISVQVLLGYRLLNDTYFPSASMLIWAYVHLALINVCVIVATILSFRRVRARKIAEESKVVGSM